jgi:hypothetical protein
MRPAGTLALIATSLLAAPLGVAQPPDDGPANRQQQTTTPNVVDRMMAFDVDKDDRLTKSEVTDARLKRLFDQADADKDGLVTRSELNALMVRERASARSKMAGPGGGRMGFGGPGGGPGGFGGPGGGRGFGGPPRPGQILPAMLRRQLSLSAEQEKQIDTLQKDVDARLAKILNEDQRRQLKEMSERGPGGRFGGPGGFGGPPPGDGPPPGQGPDDGPPPR